MHIIINNEWITNGNVFFSYLFRIAYFIKRPANNIHHTAEKQRSTSPAIGAGKGRHAWGGAPRKSWNLNWTQTLASARCNWKSHSVTCGKWTGMNTLEKHRFKPWKSKYAHHWLSPGHISNQAKLAKASQKTTKIYIWIYVCVYICIFFP